jgi:AcrR family transcriptional regulator
MEAILSRQYDLRASNRLALVGLYAGVVPKLWTETIEGHRREVREAILDATWQLAAERGPLSVTMSQVAQATGIGRATLYKYFADVEAILHAWHERQIARHLEQLAEIRDGSVDAGDRLEAVLQTYAAIMHQRAQHGAGLGTLLHRTHSGEHAVHAQQQLNDMIRDLLAEGASSGDVRNDIAPEELAAFCLHALAAAGTLPSEDAVPRLVMLTLDGLRKATH